MESLERFQQTHRVIEDFTSRSLAAVATRFGRLLYLATLRDLATGLYRHEGLATIYSAGAVHEALAYCHEEAFSRILEIPLEEQEEDLCDCLSSWEGKAEEAAARWRELDFFRLLVPLNAPCYLRELFLSNLRILFCLITEQKASLRPAA